MYIYIIVLMLAFVMFWNTHFYTFFLPFNRLWRHLFLQLQLLHWYQLYSAHVKQVVLHALVVLSDSVQRVVAIVIDICVFFSKYIFPLVMYLSAFNFLFFNTLNLMKLIGIFKRKPILNIVITSRLNRA